MIRDPKSRSRLPLAVALAAVAALVALAWTGVPGRLGLTMPGGEAPGPLTLESVVERHMRELLETREFRARVEGLSPEEARELGMELAARGIARLDADSLVARARLMAAALAGTDESTCAAMGRGEATFQQLEAALLGIGRERLEAWAALSSRAILAELHGQPGRALTREQARAAVRALGALLPDAEARRLESTLADPGAATDADVCWMGRTLYRGVDRLEGEPRIDLARALATP